MSQRVKRPNRFDDGSVQVKRRKRTTAEEEEAASLAMAQAAQTPWQSRSTDLKSIYNRTTTEAPAELFRKDLISAMKLPDSEPLASAQYWIIVDPWKQEWERGVQVPVNPDSLPEPSVTVSYNKYFKSHKEFKLPKNKYVRLTNDESFDVNLHMLSHAPAQAEAACSYDLDEYDVAWLKILNAERASCGLNPIFEDQLERTVERLELCCWEKIQSILRNEEGLGIEYDENVICDVCRSPDSEDGNEMVFCDKCNICVHQACYGITRIPDGQWLCCTCNIGKRPDCVLCPNKGGAMKSTRTGQKWAHVSCALWIPEVSIGCVEKMEPITKISSIPSSRWALVCVLCRERVGACIQCSVKTCKTAYHVTCAFKHGLEMRAIIEDDNEDNGVKLRSYCEKHSKSSKKGEKNVSEDDDCKRKKRKDMTNEEKNQVRAARLQEIEAEFFKYVTIKDLNLHSEVDSDTLDYIYNYWKLKRKAGNNKPLLPPKSEDVDVLSHSREEADIEKMKMFVHVRQDLERVRNLCYMVSRREKLSRSFFRTREQTFYKQAAVLESSNALPSTVVEAVLEANHGPSVYDRLYSHNVVEDHTYDFNVIMARIAGIKSPTHSKEEHKTEVNGLFRDIRINSYKKTYFNGSSKRKTASSDDSSLSSSTYDDNPKHVKENQLLSSSEENKFNRTNKKPKTPRKQNGRQRKRILSKSKIETSSEDEKFEKMEQLSRSRLGQIASELGDTGSETETELLPIKAPREYDNHKKRNSPIYSDSDSSDASMKNYASGATSDSRNKLRTKAAVKEFSNKPSNVKSLNKNIPIAATATVSKKKSRSEENSTKKKDYVPTELIVPQRQAAKKATENLKLTNKYKDGSATQPEDHPHKIEEKDKKEHKPKGKTKIVKELLKEATRDLESKDKRRENKSKSERSAKENDVQELFPLVPQRQAAKKAAEHIKSGLGKANSSSDISTIAEVKVKEPPPSDSWTRNKKEHDKRMKSAEPTTIREDNDNPPQKIQEIRRKSSVHSNHSSTSSTTSSSSGSSDSGSTCSTDSEDESDVNKPTVDTNPQNKLENNAKDRPFLDKAAQFAASSSSSSDSSDSSSSSSPGKSSSASEKTFPQLSTKLSKSSHPSSRKSPSHSRQPIQTSSPRAQTELATSDTKRIRKPSTDEKLSQSKKEEASARGDGSTKISRNRTHSATSQMSNIRFGSADVRPRNMSDSRRISLERERNMVAKSENSDCSTSHSSKEQNFKSHSKLLTPIGKTERKLKEIAPSPTQKELEREIAQRKLEKDIELKKSKSNINHLFDAAIRKPSPKLENEHVKSRSKSNEIPKLSTENKVPENKLNNLIDASSKKPSRTIQNISKPNPTVKNVEKRDMKDQTDKKVESQARKSVKKSASKSKTDIMNTLSNDKKINEFKEKEVPFSPKNKEDSRSSAKSDQLSTNKLKDSEFSQNQSLMETCESKDFTIDEMATINTSKPLEPVQDTSIFSPQPQHNQKGPDMMDLDGFDENFGLSKEELMKGPMLFSFNSSMKEDTREDSARETLNLVEKLRLGLTKKSNCGENDESNISVEKAKEDTMDHVDKVPSEVEMNVEKIEPIPNPTIINNVNEHYSKEFFPADSETMENSQSFSVSHSKPSTISADLPIKESQNLIHSTPIQGDERWVPPSDNYNNNIQLSTKCHNYLSESQFIHQYHSRSDQNMSNSLASQTNVELSQKEVPPDNLPTYVPRPAPPPTPLPFDIMPSSSPYAGIHPHRAYGADSTMMPNRRSSSSSNSSSSSRREEDNKVHEDVKVVNHTSLDIATYMSQLQHFPPSMDSFTPYTDPSSQFIPVSLFAPPNLPFSSTGIFPPPFAAPFSTSHSLASLPKSVEETVSFSTTHNVAAFTSSQHNMAFTAAMVNMSTTTSNSSSTTTTTTITTNESSDQASKIPEPDPPAVTEPEPAQSITVPPSTEVPTIPTNEEVLPTSALSSANTPSNISLPSPSTSSKSSMGKKSPSKPTRTSARVTQLMSKSPAISPGKSPKQDIAQRQGNVGKSRSDTKKNSGKSSVSKSQVSTRGNRARGRGRGRGGIHHNDYDFNMTNTIHNKLVGTVYDLDFEDDISNDNMTDLKSMRERRRSIDIHEKKHDIFNSPRSPKFSSPKNRYANELKSNVIEDSKVKNDIVANETCSSFPVVAPVLPGPVDMRTYNNASFDQHSYNEQTLLSAFASGTAGTRVHEDIDEDLEKELHSALSVKSNVQPVELNSNNNSSNMKVSLSDSRNQLKVKIKGPIANYTSPIIAPPPTNDSISHSAIPNNNNIGNNMSTGIPPEGSSNLRRMRKKELLRQYWTQNMNTDDRSSCSGFSNTPSLQIPHRTIITIPKAVASMTSIPTKEDYRDYRTDDHFETKYHKKSRLSRELKQLDLSMDDDLSERRRSIGNNNSNSFNDSGSRKRGRPPRSTPGTPKLKIKIGNENSIVTSEKVEEKNTKPPKKRLATMQKPSVDDLKRECMKFRKKVMADLKVKKKKRDKNDKHRKKERGKSEAKVEIVSGESNSTKLIIRFGKSKSNNNDNSIRTNDDDVNNIRKNDSKSFENNEQKTQHKPIKLKLSRCGEGSGYIMKPATSCDQRSTKTEDDQSIQPGQPPPSHLLNENSTTTINTAEPDPLEGLPESLQQDPPPPPLNKDCEVR